MFPDFNIYSTPLLILTIQGLIFAFLLLWRYYRQKKSSDLFLAIILLITCFHQTGYTIGFMGWYDTFRNTKINYYLVSLSLALAPLIYFYFRSVTNPKKKFTKKDVLHFVPIIVLLLIRAAILIYDTHQTGFTETQNGVLVVKFQWKYLDPIAELLAMLQMLIYLVLSFQLRYAYKEKIRQYFSNTYNLELDWLRNFLVAYSILFLYYCLQTVIDSVIVNLSWIQEWWYYFLTGLVIIYVAIKGYFTDISPEILLFLNEERRPIRENGIADLQDQLSQQQVLDKNAIIAYFETEKPYLEPELTLTLLAEKLSMSREYLSEVINKGFQQRFNDFINFYRIEEFKARLHQGQHKKISLIGIAYGCGFNSKATFNRAFKKFTNQSPSTYIASLK